MSSPMQPYVSYLLRLWLAGDAGQPQWRASLEDSRTGQVCGFANLEALFSFIEQILVEEQNKGDQAEGHDD